MDTQPNHIEALVHKFEKYAKTNIKLYKFKLIDKASDIIARSFMYCVYAAIAFLFVITINIGIALWIGDLLGKIYYGFFCVAGFYIIIGCVLVYFLKNYFKLKIVNLIIIKMLS